MKPSKIEKVIFYISLKIVSNFRPGWGTKIQYYFFKKWGMKFNGKPNYLSSKIWFDGTDYTLISIGKEVTMSSFIRVLTHDWSLNTVAKAFHISQDSPIGKIKGVKIGDFTFVGTGSILMPGCEIGKCCIIAAGTVVRGNIPDYSIYGGSPGVIIGNTKDYINKNLNLSIQ